MNQHGSDYCVGVKRGRRLAVATRYGLGWTCEVLLRTAVSQLAQPERPAPVARPNRLSKGSRVVTRRSMSFEPATGRHCEADEGIH